MSVFLTLLELNFSGVKRILYFPEYKKLFLSGFFCSKKKIWGKGRFFNKNHGLTRLQIVDFFRLCENFTFQVQKALFSIQNIKNVSFWLFLLKKNISGNRSIFWKKPWTNPFAKWRFFDFTRVSPFRSKKHSLLSRISKYVSFLLCLLKKNI